MTPLVERLARAGGGPGKPLAPHHLAPQDRGQVIGLLLIGARGHDRGAAVVVAYEGAAVVQGEGWIGPCELGVPDHLLDVGKPTPAKFRWPVDAGPAPLVQGALPSQVEFAHRLPHGGPLLGWEVVAKPGASLVAELLFLLGDLQIHDRLQVAPCPGANPKTTKT